MPSIKVNILANLVGKVWVAAINILLVPQYIKYLGIESYGMIGFFTTLLASMVILDLGLGTTLNRELSKFANGNLPSSSIRNLTYSLEWIYWLIGIVICIGVTLLSGLIARHWVNAETLSSDTVQQAVMLMGLVIVFQWPITLYNGGLTGLERQVLNNTIAIGMTTLRAVGALVILEYVSASLQAFFIWQSGISMIHVIAMRIALWKGMPTGSEKPRFSRDELKIVYKFAVGVTGISAVTFLLSQVDKIILSKILPLSEFAYYTLAFTLASAVSLVINPVSAAFFPRFFSYVSTGNTEGLKKIYHQSSTLMASLIYPLCFVLIFFTYDILRIWTGNIETTESTYLIARILICGSMINALMVMPYVLILANGWTKFTFFQNLIASVLLVPLIFIWTNIYGAIGAAVVWLVVNCGYILISQPLMHKRLLKTELFRWYWRDTIIPICPPLVTVLIIKFVLIYFLPTFSVNIYVIGFACIATGGISLLSMPESLHFIKKIIAGAA